MIASIEGMACHNTDEDVRAAVSLLFPFLVKTLYYDLEVIDSDALAEWKNIEKVDGSPEKRLFESTLLQRMLSAWEAGDSEDDATSSGSSSDSSGGSSSGSGGEEEEEE